MGRISSGTEDYTVNFDKAIDKESQLKNLLARMTLNDLYLPEEKVLPKHSHVYVKHMWFIMN